MADKSVLEKVAAAVALVSIAVSVTGTKGCQEDYSVGAQTSIATAVPTNTATSLSSATPTPNGSVTAVVGTPTETPSEEIIEGESDLDGSEETGLLEELSVLGDKKDDDVLSPVAGGGAPQQGNGNWLGKGFDGSNGGSADWEDSDGDGFSNTREEGSGSDVNDATSVPGDAERGQLESRIRQLDQDMDGLLNEDESKRGTNPNLSDSDGDGLSDGAEVLSGSDPLDPAAIYVDSDGDGLSDSFEQGRGFNPNSNDSDNDGLRDDLELVVGSNPLKVDSDGDGISDGREYDLNSDPLLGQLDRAAQ